MLAISHNITNRILHLIDDTFEESGAPQKCVLTIHALALAHDTDHSWRTRHRREVLVLFYS